MCELSVNSVDAILRIIIDHVCFLEFTDEEVLNVDVAVQQMEQIAASLLAVDSEVRVSFERTCRAYSKELAAVNTELSQFVRALPENIGIR